jgi:hypothetical protein
MDGDISIHVGAGLLGFRFPIQRPTFDAKNVKSKLEFHIR